MISLSLESVLEGIVETGDTSAPATEALLASYPEYAEDILDFLGAMSLQQVLSGPLPTVDTAAIVDRVLESL